jgi:hypothetical protein
VLNHIPQVLCPQGCTHDPCQPPVVSILVVAPRGRGRPRLTNEEVKLILAEAIHAVQRRGAPITQEAVCKQARWPSSASRLAGWAKRLGYPNWRALVNDLKLTQIP